MRATDKYFCYHLLLLIYCFVTVLAAPVGKTTRTTAKPGKTTPSRIMIFDHQDQADDVDRDWEEEVFNNDYDNPETPRHKELHAELMKLFSKAPSDIYDIGATDDATEIYEVETLQRSLVLGDKHSDFTIPNKNKEAWQLSDNAIWSHKKGVTLVASPNSSTSGFLFSKKPLPSIFFNDDDVSKRDWQIGIEFNLITDNILGDFSDPAHDAAIIFASKKAFKQIQADDFELQKLPIGESFAVAITARQNPTAPNETVLAVKAVRRHPFNLDIMTHALQHNSHASCVAVYQPLKSTSGRKFALTSEIAISGNRLSDLLYIELPYAKCILEFYPGLIMTKDDLHLAIAAWPRYSLDNFVVTSLSVASSAIKKIEYRPPALIWQSFFNSKLNSNDKTIVESFEITSLEDKLLNETDEPAVKEQQHPSKVSPFGLIDVPDKEKYYHHILENFALTLPLDEEKWQLHGSAMTDESKFYLNSEQRSNRSGLLISVNSAPPGDSSWRLDSAFHIAQTAFNESEWGVGSQSWGSFALKLVSKRVAQLIFDDEPSNVISSALLGAGNYLDEPMLTVWFGITLSSYQNIGTVVCKTSKTENKAINRNCVAANGAMRGNEIFNETVTVSIVKDGRSVTVQLQWWKGVEGESEAIARRREPICTEEFTFKETEWPFVGNDSLYVVATAPPVLGHRGINSFRIIGVELVHLTMAPIITVQALTLPQIPVFASENEVAAISVPICLDSSLTECLLDCSTKLASPYPITLWLKHPVDSPGRLQEINGADGLAVLQMAKVADLKVGDKVICIVRNNYGYTRRTFTMVDALSWRSGAVLQRWHGALLFFCGVFTALLGAAVSFGVVFLRSRLAKWRGGGHGDTYSLLNRADELQ